MALAQLYTLSTLIGAVALINFIAMTAVWRIHRGVPGLRTWALAQLAYVIGWVPSMFVPSSTFGNPLFTAYNNSLNLAGLLLIAEGTLRFRRIGSASSRLPLLLATLVIIVIMSWINGSNAVARYLFHDAVGLLLMTASGLAMVWRVSPSTRMVHLLAGFYLFAQAVAYGVRWGLALSVSAGWTDVGVQSFNFVIFSTLVLCGLGTLYGLILSVNAEVKAEVWRIGLIDPLTGLDNRRALEKGLEKALALRERTGSLLGLIYFDLDGFKPVNDRWGHEVGDSVLIEVAHRVRRFVRAQDQAARVGGDEFVVALHDLRETGNLTDAASRLRQVIEGPMTLRSGSTVDIRLSLGTSLAPTQATDADSLLRIADNCMYQNKRDRQTPGIVAPPNSLWDAEARSPS